ncbi:hypothetical protein GOODEAATRI_019410 [Goodea atripinnis]|uniref:GYF domain-containing protein n=1 Tax=Goodea atripinnis TaxID=208336 RepID=A0ABV0NDF0_9TELE
MVNRNLMLNSCVGLDAQTLNNFRVGEGGEEVMEGFTKEVLTMWKVLVVEGGKFIALKAGRKARGGTYEDGGTGLPRKHEFTRSESENWRTSRDDQNGEDDEGGWHLAGSRRDNDRWCPPSPAGWREQPDQRRRFPFDAREEERGYRRSGSGSLEDERDSLPEWCLEDADEEAGTFDSSGAFLSLKKASKEPIPEEAELDFRPLEECDEGLEEEDILHRETKETEKEAKREPDRKDLARVSEEGPSVVPAMASTVSESQPAPQNLSPNQPSRTEETERPAERRPPLELPPEPCKAPLRVPKSSSMLESHSMTHISTTLTGPFSNLEMSDWFQAGYFTVSLLVKRGCDEVFQALGEMMKIWGRVPFTPGPAPPPLQADGDQERLKRQQELTALNLYQLQQLQYQYLLRYLTSPKRNPTALSHSSLCSHIILYRNICIMHLNRPVC